MMVSSIRMLTHESQGLKDNSETTKFHKQRFSKYMPVLRDPCPLHTPFSNKLKPFTYNSTGYPLQCIYDDSTSQWKELL